MENKILLLPEKESIKSNNESEQLLYNLNNNNEQKEKNKIFFNKEKEIILEKIKILNKKNELKNFINEIKKEINNKEIPIEQKMKNLFNTNSDFLFIWKFCYSLFTVFIIYLYFFYFVFITLTNKESNDYTDIQYCLYYLIILMNFFDLIISINVLIFNSGSFLSYFKLIFRIYNAIPFPLKHQYKIVYLPKFFRIDLIEYIFDIFYNLESNLFIEYQKISHNILFTKNLIKIINFLLIYFVYAHISAILYLYYNFKNDKNFSMKNNYIFSLYQTIETFASIGFGEDPLKPRNDSARVIRIINLYISINFFAIILSSVNFMKIKLNKNFNNLIIIFNFFGIKIEKSTKKGFPIMLRRMILKEYIFNKELCYRTLISDNIYIYSLISNEKKNKLYNFLFKFFLERYETLFKDISVNFIYKIIEKLIPIKFPQNENIINIGEKVDKLYFLYYGEIEGENNDLYDNHVLFQSSTIFGDYEFFTNSISNLNYNCRNYKFNCYGYILLMNDWEKIKKNDVENSQKLIKLSIKKKLYQIKNLKLKENIKLNLKKNKNKNQKNLNLNKNKHLKILNNNIDNIKLKIAELELKFINLKKEINKNI